jgi:hypothetical protein
MTSAEMTALVSAELKYIPKGPGHQNLLRMCYNLSRRMSLGKNAACRQSATQVLLHSIDAVKKGNPDAKFYYDKQFFVGAP